MTDAIQELRGWAKSSLTRDLYMGCKSVSQSLSEAAQAHADALDRIARMEDALETIAQVGKRSKFTREVADCALAALGDITEKG